EMATAALYQQKFHEASTILAPYFEQQANQTFDVALDLAFSLYSEGLYFEAAKKYEIALALRPDDFKVLNDLGVVRTLLAQYKDAEVLLDRSLDIMNGKLAPNDPEIATTWANKGRLFRALRRFDEARDATDKASTIVMANFGQDSARMYESYNDYGDLYQDQGNHLLAQRNYIKSLQLIEANKTKVAQIEYLVVLMNLASAERDSGELDRSAADFKRSLQLADKLIANGTIRSDHPIVGSIHNEYYGVFEKRQQFDDAEREILQARDIWSKSLGENHPSFATALNNLASNYVNTSRPALALPLFQRVVSIHEKALGLEHPLTGNSFENLASCYLELGLLSEAEPVFEKALSILENKQGYEMTLASVHNNLGGLYTQSRKFDLAESHLLEAIKLREGVSGQTLEYTKSLINLGALYRIEKRFTEAEPLLRNALNLRKTSPGIGTQAVVEALAQLGGLFFVQEKY
ncbi:MAG TPA: tetratricopeptide repeat protein, partial [Pyrinomonadaceae bacterium]|nr:tetratricopeptide repeat protein [Pyrinomonadaceae bacterium]